MAGIAWQRALTIAWILPALGLGCGSSEEAGTAGAAGSSEDAAACLCTPGTQTACACGGGVTGYQRCEPGCRSFGACECLEAGQGGAAGEASAGGSGGSAGAAGSAGEAGAAGAAGSTGVCTPGARQCDALTPQECDLEGQWQSGSPCEFLCLDGACTGVCHPAATDCLGAIPRLCSEQAQWKEGAPCPYLCTGGQCAGVCVPQVAQCDGLVPQTCGPEGQWQSGNACPFVCAAGECKGACVPGTVQCSGLIPQVCKADGSWQDGTSCEHVCHDGACVGVCDPGEQQCEGLTPQTCDALGAWQSGTSCPYVCLGGQCTGECSPSAKRCMDKVPQSCDEAGAWQGSTACPYVCKDGLCAGVCEPGTAQCKGSIPQTCEGNYEWQDGTACTVGCFAGACLPQDGTIEPGNATHPNLLVAPGDKLVVIYNDGGTPNVLKKAQYEPDGWSLTDLSSGHFSLKDAAHVDAAGNYHVAVQGDSNTAYYLKSEGGWGTTLIPSIPGSSMTAALDANGKLHVTSATSLSTRYYATNASGSFVSTSIATSNTAPAAILATPGLPVTVVYNHWSSRTIYLTDATNWSNQKVLEHYTIDNGPGLSLKAHNQKLHVVYGFCDTSYSYSNLVHQTNQSGTWVRTVIGTDMIRATSPDLTIAPDGTRHVVVCDDANVLKYFTDKSGSWATHVLSTGVCARTALDTVWYHGRLYVAYVGTDGKLKLTSFDPASY